MSNRSSSRRSTANTGALAADTSFGWRFPRPYTEADVRAAVARQLGPYEAELCEYRRIDSVEWPWAVIRPCTADGYQRIRLLGADSAQYVRPVLPPVGRAGGVGYRSEPAPLQYLPIWPWL